MHLKITSQFAKDFKGLKDNSLHEKLKEVLESIKKAKNIGDSNHFRKINGNPNAYKMGIGFYYVIGILTSTNEMTLMRFLHRDMLMNVLNQKQDGKSKHF